MKRMGGHYYEDTDKDLMARAICQLPRPEGRGIRRMKLNEIAFSR